MSPTDKISEVSSFFCDKHIFLTGGTGFMGKLLISKLLMECKPPMLYLLVRKKNSKSSIKRINELFNDPVFDPLKKEVPNYKNYITLVEGDCNESNLSISAESEKILLENVEVVIHAAASVRFMGPLKDIIKSNTIGTLNVVEFAEKMMKLKIFVHVSSISTNMEQKLIKEEICDLHLTYNDLSCLLKLDNIIPIEKIKHKLIGNKGIEYILSKAAAEQIFQQKTLNCPVVIYRCALVTPCWKEPIPGWTVNLNGIIGFLILILYNIKSNFHSSHFPIIDFIPGDHTANALLAITFFSYQKFHTVDKNRNKLTPYVFNHSNYSNRYTVEEIIKLINKHLKTEIKYCTKKSIYIINEILFSYIPSIIIDMILFVRGSKLRTLKMFRSIQSLINVSQKINLEYEVIDDNLQECWNSLNEIDKKIFQFNINDIDKEEYFLSGYNGITQFVKRQTYCEDILLLSFWLPKVRLIVGVCYFILGILFINFIKNYFF